MNIFFIHTDATICAQSHVDDHVKKMVIEYAQMLSTAHRVLDGEIYTELTDKGRKIKRWRHLDPEMDTTLYRSTHVNHPCNKWVRESLANYEWLYQLYVAVADEYVHRELKVNVIDNEMRNLADIKLRHVLDLPPVNIPDVGLTQPALAMPDIYKQKDAVAAYIDFYIHDKAHLREYTRREEPNWWPALAA